MTLFVFTMPSLQGILCRVTQLPDCRLDAFSQLQIEPNRLNAVFVRIHGLPPGSPTFCPHPQAAQLTPSEREALQKAVSADYLEQCGLREGSHCEILNERGRTLFEVG